MRLSVFLVALRHAFVVNAAYTYIDLGTAGSFGALSYATITNTGPTSISGDVGTLGTSITGFPPGVFTGTKFLGSQAVAARNDALTAYQTLGALGGATILAGNLGNRVLGPGTYRYATSAQITGILTLAGTGSPTDAWYFQIGSTLITSVGANVILTGGAKPCNVWFRVGSSATLGVASQISGNVLAAVSITVNSGVTMNGALYALGGSITLNSARIVPQQCANAIPPSSTSAAVPTSSTLPTSAADSTVSASSTLSTSSTLSSPSTTSTIVSSSLAASSTSSSLSLSSTTTLVSSSTTTTSGSFTSTTTSTGDTTSSSVPSSTTSSSDISTSTSAGFVTSSPSISSTQSTTSQISSSSTTSVGDTSSSTQSSLSSSTTTVSSSSSFSSSSFITVPSSSSTSLVSSSTTSSVSTSPSSPAGWEYSGCYTEATSARALSAASLASDQLTVDRCATFCSSFPIFGVEYGRECYCGSALAAGSVRAPDTDCNFKCSGSSTQTCGAGNRLNVYMKPSSTVTTSASPTSTTSPTLPTSYGTLGCYTEATNGRALKEKSFSDDAMTTQKCAANCAGFKYFGLEYYFECYCGNSLQPGSVQVASTDCKFPCTGDKTQTCGANNRLNLYAFGDSSSLPTPVSSSTTSATPTPTPYPGYATTGCYTEATNMRALSGATYINNGMTVEICASACSGFAMFGVEYGRECYCGASLNSGSVSAPTSECSFVCPGNNNEFCGAGNRLNVYQFGPDPTIV